MSFLPGMFPGVAVQGGEADPSTVAMFASATSNASTIAAPASIIAGDVIVLLDDAANTSGLPTAVVPSGFTGFVNISDASNERWIMSYKIAAGTEGGTNITGMNGTSYKGKCMYVFRRTNACTSVNVVDVAYEYTAGNPTAQTINASGGAIPLVALAGYGSSNAIDPRTFSPAADGEINPDNYIYIKYKIYNSSPADVSVDMDDEGSKNFLCSAYMELS